MEAKIMSKITDSKQKDFIDSSKVGNWKVKVFGVGSIGSNLIKQLALTGFKDITAYDFDTVDEENLGSQEFDMTHLGMKKTEAIQKLMKDHYDYPVKIVEGKIEEATTLSPDADTIYFCGFDSLEARNMLWKKLKRFPVVWMESRIGRDQQRFYVLDLRNPDPLWLQDYEVSLDPEGPRTELTCGEKGTYGSNSELVAKIVRQMVNIAENKPFITMYIGAWGTPGSIYRMSNQEAPLENQVDN
jgi:molybdopterin/thiamine biosynthesis adenylyltransferase